MQLIASIVASLGNLQPGQHTRANVNGSNVNVILENESDFCADVILENEKGSCVNMILMNGNDPGMDVSWIDRIPLYIDSLYYHPFFLRYLGPFSGTYLLPQIPNLSQVYAITLRPDLFLRIVHAPRCLILFGVFDVNLL